MPASQALVISLSSMTVRLVGRIDRVQAACGERARVPVRAVWRASCASSEGSMTKSKPGVPDGESAQASRVGAGEEGDRGEGAHEDLAEAIPARSTGVDRARRQGKGQAGMAS
jgi:hypothetical protein